MMSRILTLPLFPTHRSLARHGTLESMYSTSWSHVLKMVGARTLLGLPTYDAVARLPAMRVAKLPVTHSIASPQANAYIAHTYICK